ncbi:MAG: TRAM domain-containing protein, partial [Oscillospiraceae bacterium]
GTPAAKMDDPTPHSEKTERFARLLELQDSIAAGIEAKEVGGTYRCLVTGKNDSGAFVARMDNNAVVELDGEAEENTFQNVRITGTKRHRLFGTVVE